MTTSAANTQGKCGVWVQGLGVRNLSEPASWKRKFPPLICTSTSHSWSSCAGNSKKTRWPTSSPTSTSTRTRSTSLTSERDSPSSPSCSNPRTSSEALRLFEILIAIYDTSCVFTFFFSSSFVGESPKAMPSRPPVVCCITIRHLRIVIYDLTTRINV